MRRAFIIGHPVAHSRSPLIHGHWIARHGIRGSYERIDVRPDALPAFLKDLEAEGFVGGNVTIPHKEAAFRLVDDASDMARRLAAVNTLSLGAGGRIFGHNTDGEGFSAGLDGAFGPGWPDRVGTALVLGAGGAARAVCGALVARGIGRILIANRTGARAKALADTEPVAEPVAWPDLDEALGRTDLLVNTTALGMAGQPPLRLDVDLLPLHALVADIVYVPLVTPLLAAARARGLATADGLDMLLHQAVPGFETWFGVRPEVTGELRTLVEGQLATEAAAAPATVVR